MNGFCKNEKTVLIREKKRKYVQHWLENNSYTSADFNSELNQKISPGLTEINNKYETSFLPPLSPKLSEKCLETRTYSLSPILSGKRSTLAKIQSNRKIPKKIKITQKLKAENTKEKNCLYLSKQIIENSKTQINAKQNCQQNLLFETNLDISLPKSIKISDYDHKLKIFNKSEYINTRNKNNLTTNINGKYFFKKSTIIRESTSQYIESASSDNESIDSTEINTDTDKTLSDLIEEISTQTVLVTSFKENQSLSQNISNSSSAISESTNNIHISKLNLIKSNETQKCKEKFIVTDSIDTVSTLESKIDFSKKSYILQCTNEKQKKKKNPKKGTLLDILYTKMGKERSNINLLRHQLYKKPPNVIKPFILLKIVQHLPMINENQILKCVLIEDTMNLLNSLLAKQTHSFVTVMNVPEMSCLINTIQKPILKIYEPWTILDANQLFLHITRFIAIPSPTTKEHDNIGDKTDIKNLKVTEEFDCPCIHENMFSNKCKTKLQDSLYNIVKVIFNYK